MIRNTLSRVFLIFTILITVFIAAPSINAARAADNTCKVSNSLWIGSFDYGANCLDDAGWKAYVKDKSQLQSDQVHSIAICSDGTTWIANTLGLLKISADKEQTIALNDNISSIESIACDAKGDVWLAHYQGVSHYSGGKWDTTSAKKLGTGDTVDLVKRVAVAPDGTIYVATSNSIARFDGKDWSFFEKGKGFDQEYFIDSLAIDGKGTVYAAAGSAILIYDGKTWKAQKNDGMYSTTAIAIDSKGVVWVGTSTQGVFAFDGQGWTAYNVEQNKLSSNSISTIAIDQQDRVWLGTDYGLDVLIGKEVHIYQMANSGLVDNDIKTLAVSGAGPALPKLTDPKRGSLSGTVVNGKDPVPNASVQLCTGLVPHSFSGDTPCGDQVDNVIAKTDKDGKFSFDKLPIGHYGLVLQDTNGKWRILSDSFGLNAKSDVNDGENTDLGKIDVSKKAK